MTRLPEPLRAAAIAFLVTLAVTLGIACFATLSLAPLTSTMLPAILARGVCIALAIIVACATLDATPRPRQ